MSDERDRKIVELAVQAAGTADAKWQDRVVALVPRVAAIFREPKDELDPNSLINTARKVTEAHVFAAEYRDYEYDDTGRDGNRPTQRLFVRIHDKDADGEYLDADGCQTLRTEPMWTASGRAIRRILDQMQSGQRGVFYRYTEQIDKKRKMGLLVHVEPLSTRTRAAQPDRSPPSDREPAARQDPEGARPPSGSDFDKNIALLERRYEEITGVWRVRLAKRANDELGVGAVLLPPDDKIDDVLALMDRIEQERDEAT